MLRAGIVGLPNVGKSTLFNALTKTHKAESANYPFCTIDPNVGVVSVPDARLEALAKIAKTQNIVPAIIEFVDIAGLVPGAARGEGLGNQFLAHIREVDAIVHVVRCFEDSQIHHIEARIDPLRDIETILTELILADLESVQNGLMRRAKSVKRGDKKAIVESEVLAKLEPHLNAGKAAMTLDLSAKEKALLHSFFLLTNKPTLFVANVKENELASTKNNPFVHNIKDYTNEHDACRYIILSAQLESDLISLSAAESSEFLREFGVAESGVTDLIRMTYDLLGLQTFFTAGEKEVRAWTIVKGDVARTAAGVIHTDFDRGFIKAQTLSYEDIIRCGSIAQAREKGLYRMEGKDYIVQDGDIIHFKFNI